jgi:hypothetical protein
MNNDPWVFRFIAIFIGLTSMVIIVGIFLLAAYNKSVPESMTELAAICVNGLMLWLTPSPLQIQRKNETK